MIEDIVIQNDRRQLGPYSLYVRSKYGQSWYTGFTFRSYERASKVRDTLFHALKEEGQIAPEVCNACGRPLDEH